MNADEYKKWTRHHADIFRMHADRDLDVFITWEPRLIAFTFADLREASYAIADDPRHTFRENHLGLLRASVISKRAEKAAREREQRESQYASGSCESCHSVGLVRVPHPDFIENGEFTRRVFLDVACNCRIGVARLNAVNARLAAAESPHLLIDVAEYEEMIPDWRLVLAAAEEADEQDHAATDLARQVDRTIGPIIGRKDQS
ncbi:MAG TPA: hypothetical protein VFE62_22700 [Gemmataceae bacterium]|nr:hypothetical protein [Gemmataceae bacterium]